MTYEEFAASISEALQKVTAGNIAFAVILLIAVIAGIVVFTLYTRKEYYRKRSQIDDFMLDEKEEKDIYVPGISDKKKKEEPTITEKIYDYLNKDN